MTTPIAITAFVLAVCLAFAIVVAKLQHGKPIEQKPPPKMITPHPLWRTRWQIYGAIGIVIATMLVGLLFLPDCSRPDSPAKPYDPAAGFTAATNAMRSDKPREAIELFTAVIAVQPNNDSAYVNRAACYGSLEEYTPMLKDILKALELNETNVRAHELGASYWLKIGDKEKAHATAARLLLIDPGNAVASKVLGAVRE